MDDLLLHQKAQIQSIAAPRPFAPKLHEQFLLYQEADGCSESTLRWFQNAISDLLKFCGRDLGDLRDDDIAAWLVHLRRRTSKHPDHHDDRKLKPNTINGYWRAIRQFYRWAHDRERIARDPTRTIKGPKPSRSRIATYKPHHVKAMLELCPPNTVWGARDRAIILTFLGTGVRLSELVTMKLPELNLRTRCISVQGKGTKRKGPRTRIIYLDQRTVKAIINWLAFRPPVASDALWLTLGHGPRPLTSNAVKCILDRINNSVQAPDIKISAHRFRHTFGLNMLRQGKDIRYVQAVMGHEDLASTEIYVRALTEEDAIEWRKQIDPFKDWGL